MTPSKSIDKIHGKNKGQDLNVVGVIEDKDEWIKSELPALEQITAMGFEYKSQAS
jgi:hypothetical protein